MERASWVMGPQAAPNGAWHQSGGRLAINMALLTELAEGAYGLQSGSEARLGRGFGAPTAGPPAPPSAPERHQLTAAALPRSGHARGRE